jgi:hypothetical protein
LRRRTETIEFSLSSLQKSRKSNSTTKTEYSNAKQRNSESEIHHIDLHEGLQKSPRSPASEALGKPHYQMRGAIL